MSVPLLYVEDDNDLRAMMKVLLLREGYDVTAVSTAEDAIVELQTGRYQLLLTDYNLPNKNANWMLQVARAGGCLDTVQVVIMTATADPEGVERYRLLRKPVDISVLFAALDEAVAALDKPFEVGCEPVPWDGRTVMLTLYVTGTSRESKKALRNLRRIFNKCESGRVRLHVCDVVTIGETAARAQEEDRVVVTPTLVRQQPLPKVWLFGDLSKDEAVEDIIGIGSDELAVERDRNVT